MAVNDRRAVRTRNALKRGALQLLAKKDISKISVTELSELADIGRGTFYLHYLDPYDLLDKIEDELLGEITSHTAPVINNFDSAGLLRHLENIWSYVYDNKETFSVLMNPRNRGRFMEKFRRCCIESVYAGYGMNAGAEKSLSTGYDADFNVSAGAPEKNVDPTGEYSTIYIISGSLGVFEKWMENGAPVPPDELAQIVRDLITHG